MRGRSIRVIAAVLAFAAVAGTSASASGASSPAATAEAVLIDPQPQGTPATGTLPATFPDNPTVTVTDWSSSTDQPLVTLDSGTSTAASAHGISSGAVQLAGISLFGGEIQLQSLNVAASTATDAVDVSGEGLVVDGLPVDLPAAGTSTPLDDWGTLAAGNQSTTAGDRTVLGLVITLSSDHDGLPAGSSIALGAITSSA